MIGCKSIAGENAEEVGAGKRGGDSLACTCADPLQPAKVVACTHATHAPKAGTAVQERGMTRRALGPAAKPVADAEEPPSPDLEPDAAAAIARRRAERRSVTGPQSLQPRHSWLYFPVWDRGPGRGRRPRPFIGGLGQRPRTQITVAPRRQIWAWRRQARGRPSFSWRRDGAAPGSSR